MKKLILFALASFLISSCRKDDDDKKSEPIIAGTWMYTKKQLMSGKDNSVLFSEAIIDCPDKRSYQFSGNNYTLTIFKDNFVGSCVIDETENGTFGYDQNKITFKSTRTNNEYSMSVNSLTNEELQLIDPFFGYDANNDGVQDKFVMVFHK